MRYIGSFMTISNKRNRIFLLLLILSPLFFMVGCSNEKEDANTLKNDNNVFIYYMDKNETNIESEVYTPVNTSTEELAVELLGKLKEEPKSLSLKKSWPDNITVEKYNINEGNRFSIYFNAEYNNLDNITEVLFRTCVVKTLCQIDGIDNVEFYVGGHLLKINDKLVGLMDESDFVVDTGYEDVIVRVYFSNQEGSKLLESNLKIPYLGNISIEKLIIDQLIAGPIKEEEDMINTLPSGTELIKVTTKDGICYVDFNDKFLDKVVGVKDEVIIYSVVNSLIELSTINKVKFTINGQEKKSYRDIDNFDEEFERNLEIVEGSK